MTSREIMNSLFLQPTTRRTLTHTGGNNPTTHLVVAQLNPQTRRRSRGPDPTTL